MCFNASGIPGSDDGLSFEDKTVGTEVQDTLNIITHIQEKMFVAAEPSPTVHVLGLSTGAIISALLRKPLSIGKFGKCTITSVAGLLDEKQGIKLDFDETQLTGEISYSKFPTTIRSVPIVLLLLFFVLMNFPDFEQHGFCWKEFWLRADMPPQPCEKEPEQGSSQEEQAKQGSNKQNTTRKTRLRLRRAYLDEFVEGKLNVQESVSVGGDCVPMLVCHGDKDNSVPLDCGRALYEAAAEPKSW